MNQEEKEKIQISYAKFIGRDYEYCGLPDFEKVPPVYYEGK